MSISSGARQSTRKYPADSAIGSIHARQINGDLGSRSTQVHNSHHGKATIIFRRYRPGGEFGRREEVSRHRSLLVSVESGETQILGHVQPLRDMAITNSTIRSAVRESADHRKLWCAIFLACSGSIHVSAQTSGTLQNDNVAKLMAAQAVQRKYIDPLHLSGKTAKNAIDVMAAEGFSCNVKAAYLVPNGHYRPAIVDCRQFHSHLNERCEEVDVSLSVDWLKAVQSEHELLDQLDTSLVTSYFTFCPYRSPRFGKDV